jgi:lauroyl/myristoyl acyltransferase
MFASLDRLGVKIQLVLSPLILGPDTGIAMRQHKHVMGHRAEVFPATGGTDAIASLVRPGGTLALASDIHGQTPIRFLGRNVIGSFGAARIATMTDTPVVVVTTLRDAAGSYLQVHEPLEPRDFDGPRDLLDAMLRRHEEAVLAWPEAFEAPMSRWGTADE